MGIHLAFSRWMAIFSLALVGTAADAQDTDAVLGSPGGWQRYDWLSPSDSTAVATGGKVATTAGQTISDPFAVATNGALWQEKYGATYTQSIAGNLKLLYDTDTVTLNEASQNFSTGTPDDLSHDQKAGLQFQPMAQLTLGGNVHDSADDASSPASSVETRGAGVTAEAHLPFNSVLSLDGNSDTTTIGATSAGATVGDSYDAQLKQPLGKLPVTAIVKGHYEDTSEGGKVTSNLPSLEQSLVWKPADATTVQMGLRQQQYQYFPGDSNALNEAVFADWSQSLLPEVTWHSYAEVLSSRGTQDVAPAVPTTSGANGTPQSADPTNSLGVPTSFTDEAITFSTGPSFKLDRDVSASVEYSNRIDHNAVPGNAGEDQRVSVSLKGSF